MSNKAVSVYADALKREKEEAQRPTSPSSTEAATKAQTRAEDAGHGAAQQTKTPASKQARQHASTPASRPASKRASKRRSTGSDTGAGADARRRARLYDRVRKAVINRSRLGGFTFRYQREELDRLDAVSQQVNQGQAIQVSKNDLARIALLWLLEDYDENKLRSVLASVLARLRR